MLRRGVGFPSGYPIVVECPRSGARYRHPFHCWARVDASLGSWPPLSVRFWWE